MANERAVPLLPCASIDEMRDFFVPLGFEVTHRQLRPNPYLALRREDLDLHYFGLDGLRPEDSYSSCLVLVDDTAPIFGAFSVALRAQYGKLPMSGYPRITRPRARKNADGLSGFSLVDPSGNWIRFLRVQDQAARGPVETTSGPLGAALANAVVLADSKGDVDQASKILDGALARFRASCPKPELVRALGYLAELSVRRSDFDRFGALVDELARVPLSAAEKRETASTFDEVAELGLSLPSA